MDSNTTGFIKNEHITAIGAKVITMPGYLTGEQPE
jgi:hypothetical protein